jgi:hypothetical protein
MNSRLENNCKEKQMDAETFIIRVPITGIDLRLKPLRILAETLGQRNNPSKFKGGHYDYKEDSQ